MSENSHLQRLLLQRLLSAHVCQTASLTAAGGASRRCLMIVAVDKQAVVQQNSRPRRKAKHLNDSSRFSSLQTQHKNNDSCTLASVNPTEARLEGWRRQWDDTSANCHARNSEEERRAGWWAALTRQQLALLTKQCESPVERLPLPPLLHSHTLVTVQKLSLKSLSCSRTTCPDFGLASVYMRKKITCEAQVVPC